MPTFEQKWQARLNTKAQNAANNKAKVYHATTGPPVVQNVAAAANNPLPKGLKRTPSGQTLIRTDSGRLFTQDGKEVGCLWVCLDNWLNGFEKNANKPVSRSLGEDEVFSCCCPHLDKRAKNGCACVIS